MSAELVPAVPGPAHARSRQPRPIDVLREQELRRRIEAGQNEHQAWAAVATDERIGLVSWRGKAEIHVAAAIRTYARFLARMAPHAVAQAKDRVEYLMAATSLRNASTIQKIANGEFSDTEKARVQLAGAKEALKIVGIGADKQTRITTQVAVANSFGALLRSPLAPE